jgi:hypothetical protein
VQSHKADAHALEESDRTILSMNQTNKEERSSAEPGEKRVRAKEHIVQPNTSPTQSGERVSQGLSGVRAATLLVTHPRWEPYGAVQLVDGLAGESPASADCPVGTVVISGDGAGDQTVESPDVNVLVGWMRIWSAPTGEQAKQQVVAKRTIVKPRKPTPHQNRSVRILGMPKLSYGVEGQRLR